MRKGLANPNSIQAHKELRMEIAKELGINDIKSVEMALKTEKIQQINKRLTEEAKYNYIGFK